jgi:hypothetical protein
MADVSAETVQDGTNIDLIGIFYNLIEHLLWVEMCKPFICIDFCFMCL